MECGSCLIFYLGVTIFLINLPEPEPQKAEAGHTGLKAIGAALYPRQCERGCSCHSRVLRKGLSSCSATRPPRKQYSSPIHSSLIHRWATQKSLSECSVSCALVADPHKIPTNKPRWVEMPVYNPSPWEAKAGGSHFKNRARIGFLPQQRASRCFNGMLWLLQFCWWPLSTKNYKDWVWWLTPVTSLLGRLKTGLL